MLALIRGFFVLYGLFLTITPLFANPSTLEVRLIVGLSNGFYILCLALPLFFYRSSYGWLHPLVYAPLYAVPFLLLQKTGTFIRGLSYNIGLPGFNPDEVQTVFAYGNFLSGIASLAIIAGFHLNLKIPLYKINSCEKPSRAWPLIVVCATVISGVAMVLFARKFGGGLDFILSLTKGADSKHTLLLEDMAGMGQYTVPMRLASLCAVILLCWNAKFMKKPWFWALSFSGLWLNYLNTGKRASILLTLFKYGLAFMLRARRMPYFAVLMIGIVSFFTVGILGMFRWHNQKNTQVDFGFLKGKGLGDVTSITMAELQRRGGEAFLFYAVIGRVPEDVGFLYGKSYLENIYRFIPRYFWPDKPRGIGVQANATFVGGYWGMPVGSVGEAYWNGHIPGVILVYMLAGIVMRYFARLLLANPRSTAIFVLYIYCGLNFDFGQNELRRWLHDLIPAVLLLWILGFLRFGGPARQIMKGPFPRGHA